MVKNSSYSNNILIILSLRFIIVSGSKHNKGGNFVTYETIWSVFAKLRGAVTSLA